MKTMVMVKVRLWVSFTVIRRASLMRIVFLILWLRFASFCFPYWERKAAINEMRALGQFNNGYDLAIVMGEVSRVTQIRG